MTRRQTHARSVIRLIRANSAVHASTNASRAAAPCQGVRRRPPESSFSQPLCSSSTAASRPTNVSIDSLKDSDRPLGRSFWRRTRQDGGARLSPSASASSSSVQRVSPRSFSVSSASRGASNERHLRRGLGEIVLGARQTSAPRLARRRRADRLSLCALRRFRIYLVSMWARSSEPILNAPPSVSAGFGRTVRVREIYPAAAR